MAYRSESKVKTYVVLTIAIAILGPAGIGFIEKLALFIMAITHDQVGGAIFFPVLNYLVVTAGMACLLIWAMAHGMFRNIEKPKYDMLDREDELDRLDGLEPR